MKRRRSQPSQPPENESTGSPGQGEPVYLAVGFLRRAHGVRGEMIMDVLTDFPERLRPGNTVYLGDSREAVKIDAIRQNDRTVLVHLDGVNSPEDAARYRNTTMFIKAEGLPRLPEGSYYHHELLGLSVVDENGQALGTLEQILETGANDVYLVRTPESGELLLPAVDDVILNVDLERREVRVRPPEWL
jgi:16S rRNA processing protein RimM